MTKVVGFIKYSIVVFLIGIVSIQCKKKQEKIDFSSIEIDSELRRFDQALFEPESFGEENLDELKENFPSFYPIFARQVLRPLKGEELTAIDGFRNYFDSLSVYQHAQDQFGDFQDEFDSIKKMQQRFKYYFPNYEPADVTTLISGFGFKNALTDKSIAISLDTYLDSVDYSLMGDYIPLYQLHGFDEDYLLADVASALVDDFYPDNENYTTLLDRMIFGGKKLFLKEKLLPNAPKHTIIGMTKEDFEWCEANEADIWKYFLSEELLYSRDFNRFKSYITPGPFSAGMPEDAPAQTGDYTGWKIMESLSKKKQDESVQNLLLNYDSQAVLNAAKYDP
ncbi:MAG: hypothetical protein KTR13_09815 [Saprospiraceae bacterium]|nr:hypothetical protein [Saprospiraceae bacterium]